MTYFDIFQLTGLILLDTLTRRALLAACGILTILVVMHLMEMLIPELVMNGRVVKVTHRQGLWYVLYTDMGYGMYCTQTWVMVCTVHKHGLWYVIK